MRNFRCFSFWATSTLQKSHLVLNSVASGFADYTLLGVCDDYLSYPYRKFRTEERARIRQALEALGANCNV